LRRGAERATLENTSNQRGTMVMDRRTSSAEPGAGTAPGAADAARETVTTANLPEEPPWEHTGTPATVEEAATTIERLRREIAGQQEQIKQHEDQLLRVRSELENFKRRMQREKADALRFANEPLLRDLLPVIDNLERALAATATVRNSSNGQSGNAFEALVTGVEMVLASFKEVLGRSGVRRVETAGVAFDPARHEALAQVETSEHAAGTVVQECVPGYTLHDRLLRAAQVTVAKNPDKNRTNGSD
jgi:molecular chaperone GrpE